MTDEAGISLFATDEDEHFPRFHYGIRTMRPDVFLLEAGEALALHISCILFMHTSTLILETMTNKGSLIGVALQPNTVDVINR